MDRGGDKREAARPAPKASHSLPLAQCTRWRLCIANCVGLKFLLVWKIAEARELLRKSLSSTRRLGLACRPAAAHPVRRDVRRRHMRGGPLVEHCHVCLADAEISVRGDEGLRGPGRKYGTTVKFSGWQQQLVSRIGVPDHAPLCLCSRRSPRLVGPPARGYQAFHQLPAGLQLQVLSQITAIFLMQIRNRTHLQP